MVSTGPPPTPGADTSRRHSGRPLAAITYIAALLLSMILAACATTRTAPVPTSGFLGDYSQLHPHPDDPNVLVYRQRPGVLADYDRFYVAPVLVYFHADSRGGGIDPAEVEELAEDLRQKAVDALTDGGWEIAEEAGPGVLQVRAALTDVVPVHGAANVGTKVAGAVVGVGLLTPRVDLGRASIEVELSDGDSGERVGAYVVSSRGARYSSPIQGAQRWGDAKAAFRDWAELLARLVDAAHDEAGRAPGGNGG